MEWCGGGGGLGGVSEEVWCGEFTRDLLFHAMPLPSSRPNLVIGYRYLAVAQISPRVMAEKVGENPPKKKEKHKSKEKA